MLRESALEHRCARILVCEAATLMRADDFYTAIDGSRIRSFDATTVVTLGRLYRVSVLFPLRSSRTVAYVGELRPLIGIEDAGLAEPGEGLAQCLDTKLCCERVRQPPGQHSSSCPVDDRDQVQKPLLHGDVRDVRCPHLVRLVDRLAAQKVWVDLVLGMPLAGVALGPDRP